MLMSNKNPYLSVFTDPRAPKTAPAASASRPSKRNGPAAIGGLPVPTSASRLKPPKICLRCGAKKFQGETTGFCCSNGEVQIAGNDFPEELMKLFTLYDDDSRHFKKYARLYNSVFAFSSIGGEYESSTKKGIYVFKLHGQLYHFVPNLLPLENDVPKYLQLYFYDGQHEKQHRLNISSDLKESAVTTLINIMDQNPYAQFFRRVRDSNVTEETKITLEQNSVLDQRLFNRPVSDDVAAVWSDSSASATNRGPHVVVSGKSDKNHRIYHYYGCYDPLQYPLLFPKGDCGWHQGLKRAIPDIPSVPVDAPLSVDAMFQDTVDKMLKRESDCSLIRPTRKERFVSCREYYAYKLQIRPANYLLWTGRLFQQYIVDMYVKIENTRLDFIRTNQDKIRSDLYQGILDTLNLGENSASKVGRRVVLPPTFTGGPRDMKRRYLNAMALVLRYGKPYLFLTMTCNPNWPEVTAKLKPGELSQNRPDLLARIFQAKLQALKRQLMKRRVFGEVAAMIHVIEFQKRGLPHAHFLIILNKTSKIKTPDQFDRYVSAEIPSTENPHLRAAVLRHMMHGPCGIENPECACMTTKNHVKKCKYGYPKSYQEFTTTGNDSYPLYKRTDTGEKVRVRGSQLDNRWVIPHNPYLLAMFDCHINVEVCSTIKAVKYLFKYVYKGHDRISFNVASDSKEHSTDEIKNFQTGRWVSPPEAAWRIFGFDLFDIYPAVLPLQVHAPNMQFVQFRPDETLEEIVDDAKRSKTMLTQFFAKNAEGPESRKYLYSEFPEHYVWDSGNKMWRKRKTRPVVGRLTFASPMEGERYYLRLLLAHIRGPQSFDDLLTVDGIRYLTFQEAALKRGLLEDDDWLDQTMQDGAEVRSADAMRRLFAHILVFGRPNCPKQMWEKYYEEMSFDHRREHPNDEPTILQLTASKVQKVLEGLDKSFEMFGLGYLSNVEDPAQRRTKDLHEALTAPVPPEYVRSWKRLNSEQKTAYKSIMQCIKSNTGGAFFIDGPGGTGKTFLYCALYAKVRSQGQICLPTATSGIAASNIPTGRTAHSRFKIPIDENTSRTCDISKQTGSATLLREAALIIWDEASMARKENIEALDALLRDICDSDQLFGGKTIVFGGDFRQVLPVVPKKTQREAVDCSIVSSYVWPNLRKFSLTKNIRAQSDPHYSAFLLGLGNGELQHTDSSLVQLPGELMLPNKAEEDSLADLVQFVFPELNTPLFSPSIFNTRAILTPKNDDVDAVNKLLIDKFPQEATVYKSFDSMINENCSIYPNEFLNSLCPAGMSPHELILKENSPVILLRNLDPFSGLCNGTRMVCKRFFKNMIECEISVGYYTGQRVFLPRITMKPASSLNYPYQFQRRQFPIKLSFAMTINKAQGQTLDQVGVYLPQPCFSHGQLYVALSRAREATKVKVLSKSTSEDKKRLNLVQNVIAFEILRRCGILSSHHVLGTEVEDMNHTMTSVTDAVTDAAPLSAQ